MIRALRRAIAISWDWICDPFREEPMDVPIGLEDMHELSGGRLLEPTLNGHRLPEPR